MAIKKLDMCQRYIRVAAGWKSQKVSSRPCLFVVKTRKYFKKKRSIHTHIPYKLIISGSSGV
jgi:hypothetical protein